MIISLQNVVIEQVEENMKRAVKRDAVLNEKFHFRSALNCSMYLIC